MWHFNLALHGNCIYVSIFIFIFIFLLFAKVKTSFRNYERIACLNIDPIFQIPIQRCFISMKVSNTILPKESKYNLTKLSQFI